MAISLDLAISAVKAGRKEEGRQLLNLLIQQNPNDEKAWLWMSSVVDTDEQRARCLYHVMAINPNSDLARRGLEVLGIVVSDSRPVKIPRDSQPIHIPNPTAVSQPAPSQPVAAQPVTSSRPVPQPQRSQSQPQPEMQGAAATDARRPFLIDPKTITQELPFVPVTSPYLEQEQQPVKEPVEEPVKVSPGILAINLDETIEDDQQATDVTASEAEAAGTPAPKSELTATQKMPEPVIAAAAALAVHSTETQQMVLPQEAADIAQQLEAVAEETNAQPSADTPDDSQELLLVLEESVDTPSTPPSQPVPVAAENPSNGVSPQQPESNVQGQDPNQLGSNGQFYPPMPGMPPHTTTGAITTETRPTQPVPSAYPNPGVVPNNQNPLYPAPHANPTLGMPNQHHMTPAPMPAIHSDPTMGMPLPPPQNVMRPPSEPMPVIHSAATMGMVPYGQPYPQPQLPNPAIHSSATMMMPTMSEEEARARLESKPFIPTATATAMPLQSNAWAAAPAMGYGYDNSYEYDEEEDDGEVNILAVIIFGTLSMTALGGIGMLILLIFTTPSPVG